ncbi:MULTISPECIES: bifunctional biotin--[acetyl-CoA-carboxylase] ligase/biotin operon repressor BirA [Streptococcus]|jgi:BirA family biotin operon repressor/biotin-[acetyl-CoA-carboxylase] ligase|uniref:bifunctional biotin--[acetyl-CoA-carboxylase] ligase/biotin operon repressor BirA n=1 Tax=Streptococcus TaxID=1301 RepID=UPI00057F735A|nr:MULTISPECIES: bifunctional biotin--[acetyl-CoA-carboxylase] ligase/biotin operon repressor BirA [Streptococcus]MCY7162511.1 bifunctional biotin--[acetyl-CoA-carboxylase] ligase/biotin operon repressor BirA [Streptococcus lutetiensis]MDO4885566.1 bifunctional biotin--[acetyl-CoA-carboxylase] ligase/biotin operon repressor BirA [Streptococcus sp.]MEE0948973.1 bifunctional biotin--[acetyl-CoA-carboxylase] ligase/biotin operon repressor BirA [Streptococcus equinus]QGX45470.1 bifunctional biotin-
MKTYEKIYDYLQNKDDYISGETLAKEFELSRTAIWKAIKTLEEKGVKIDSVKKRGYKIISGDLLLPEVIAKELKIPVTINEKSESTQLDAKNNMEFDKQSHLYLAPSQEKAKGRFGRQFFASKQGGIYMSLHLKPNVPFEEIKPYTLMVASSIVKAISRLTGIETDIKWVNDIYYNGKKIAGILTEAISSVETGLITDVIIGVGINFYITDFPKAISQKAGSLFSSQPTITRNELITEIWKLFLTIPEKDLVKVYKEKSLVLNKQVTFSENDIEFSGLAIDITNQGHLLVKLDNGQEKLLRSGEISLSSWE